MVVGGLCLFLIGGILQIIQGDAVFDSLLSTGILMFCYQVGFLCFAVGLVLSFLN